MVPAGKRFIVTLAILAAFIVVAVALWPVRVAVGKKVVCTYGETLSDTIHNVSVPWWLAGRYRPEYAKRLCDRHRRAALLYKQAQALLDAGKPVEAAKKFKEVAKIDHKFKSVQRAVEVAESSSKSSGTTSGSSSGKSSTSSSSSGSQSPDTPTSSDDWNVEDLSNLIPATVEGYYSGKMSTWPNFAQSDFDAIKNPDVISVLLTVHREPSEARAIKWIQTSLSKLYKYDRKTVTVHRLQGYFGSDRTTYGYLAWHRGRIVFELLLHNGNNRPRETFDSARAFSGQMID